MKSTISSKGWALLCLVPFALFFFAFQIAPLAWVCLLYTSDAADE